MIRCDILVSANAMNQARTSDEAQLAPHPRL